MTKGGTHFGIAALVALPIVCCIGLSLLVGAGLGVAAAAWIGGLALGLAALVVAVVLVAVRVRQLDAVSRARQQRRGQHEY